ncbi:hypothetical protein [Bosea rubneri]|jgi:hypothetical protein|uniref:Signaling protein n=1 Tax=Bosea rubneri TaxID=3075434 RepID=A0ABU3S6I2_9HYPH|nr:hypothetical protein [Bosea sp. ZW T0_25]MDU0340379.1 hypothetical protein [Bosea sp. ZW T0_25]
MAAGRTNWRNMILVISLAILIGVELFGVALASGWALAGMFELGHVVAYVLMVLFSGFAAYGMLVFMRRVVKVERLTTRS